MNELFVPGDYTALINLNIRSQMDTQSVSNQVGVYGQGVPFVVYEVYPEKNGIVWGRVSSNTGSGTSRYVGLRVANQPKAKLEKAFVADNEKYPAMLDAVVVDDSKLVDAIRDLANAIRSKA